jgi:hypothetical protein
MALIGFLPVASVQFPSTILIDFPVGICMNDFTRAGKDVLSRGIDQFPTAVLFCIPTAALIDCLFKESKCLPIFLLNIFR